MGPGGAGLGLSEGGIAVLVTEDDVKRRQLFSQYADGEVEPVVSRLPDHPLEDVVFRLLAGRIADTQAGLVDFLASTFAYPTFYESHGGLEGIRAAVAEAVAKTTVTGLFFSEAGRLAPAPVAYSLARAGPALTPRSGSSPWSTGWRWQTCPASRPVRDLDAPGERRPVVGAGPTGIQA